VVDMSRVEVGFTFGRTSAGQPTLGANGVAMSLQVAQDTADESAFLCGMLKGGTCGAVLFPTRAVVNCFARLVVDDVATLGAYAVDRGISLEAHCRPWSFAFWGTSARAMAGAPG
jgi:hypothetical protein